MGNSIDGRLTSIVHAYIYVIVSNNVSDNDKCEFSSLTVICPGSNASNRTDKDHSAASSNQEWSKFLGCLKEAEDIDVEYLSRDVDVHI